MFEKIALILLACVLYMSFMLGIAALILWTREKSKLFGGLVSRAIGFCALFTSIFVMVWLIYGILITDIHLTFELLVQLALKSGGVVFFWWMALIGWHWFTDSGPGIEALSVDDESPEIQESIVKAKKYLPYFIGQVENHVDTAYAKIRLEFEEEVEVDAWAHVHGYEQGFLSVSLVESPYDHEEVDEERFDVSPSAVVDWMIVQDDGRVKGGYSYIAAFDYLERTGGRLNRTMKKQKSTLITAV